MNRKPFFGVIPPTLTLFTEHGEVDEQAQRKFLEFLIEKGVHAFFAGGTYGAGVLMTAEQRKKLLKLTMDQTRGRIPVIAHVGAIDTNTAVELAQYAESIGADAVAAIPPFFFNHTERSIIAHYSAIVQSVKMPVFAYNNPKASGFLITPKIAVELAQNGLAGMKDSSFDPVAFVLIQDKMKATGLDFEMIIGTEGLWCPAAAAGARAMVSGLANICPELMVGYYVATVEKGIEAAAAMQPKVLRARDIIKMGPTIPTCHAMLEFRGISAGVPKMPFLPLDPEQKAKVKAAMEKEGLL